ncbi:MAG: 16S rRNA processing protein RimM [Porphyromonadaceae bacterium CG2_30_38_12]|nr:MAG: 16S rRNA processing protein RimM [Porphyromonadaceae bacterium CG2_30_38_12]
MIQNDEIFPIGQINKPHGVNGELTFSFTTDVFDRQEIPYFVIEMEGIYVPFFIEDYRIKSNSSGLLKFEDINSEEKARLFFGKTIFIPKKHLNEVEDTEIEFDYFVGFELIDNQHGSLGIIVEVDQTTANTLFVIEKQNNELLIPVGEDYINHIDHENKQIFVDLPQGLLEL